MKLKRSIALVIRESEGVRRRAGCGDGAPWLLVRRPDDDEDLPGVWGLPAGTLAPDELPEDLVRRIGREKLGVTIEPGAAVAKGTTVRATYDLEMDLWTATIVAGDPDVAGEPDVADPGPGGRVAITRYAEWKWGDPAALEDGARAGSLCCRLGLALR